MDSITYYGGYLDAGYSIVEYPPASPGGVSVFEVYVTMDDGQEVIVGEFGNMLDATNAAMGWVDGTVR